MAIALAGCQNLRPLPTDISYEGPPRSADNVTLVVDSTWLDQSGQRFTDLHIYDEMLRMIEGAEKFILLDMFLYNDFQGPVPETTRPIASELTRALVRKKQRRPQILITVITDPVNTLYGGLPSPYFRQLRDAGIDVVSTNLRALRDSNPVYSFFWRLLVKPFGNEPANTLPNPLGAGKVSIRSYLELLNFKANHRKVMIVDDNGEFTALVSSANPHDGSSAHRNLAVRFSGDAVADLLRTENAVLGISNAVPVPALPMRLSESKDHGLTISVVTEGKIRQRVLQIINAAGPGTHIDLLMFYLSDRKVISALKRAEQRGAAVRLLLDPNKDAFGRTKNGVPNRPVANELHRSGISIRWCNTAGEQCHAKTLIVHDPTTGKASIVSGSANYTRRNLGDFNLETSVVIAGDSQLPLFVSAQALFDQQWANHNGRLYSLPFEAYADSSWLRRLQYRWMEWSGLGTF